MDKYGVVGLPVYLTIVLVVASAVFGYLVLSVFFLQGETDIKLAEAEIGVIVSEAESMYEHADQGTKTMVHVKIPEGVNFIVFGDLPSDGFSVPTDTSLDEDTCCNYYFVMDDGSFRSFSSFARFSGRSTSEISVLYPGSYDVCLELVKTKSDGSYVKIYSE